MKALVAEDDLVFRLLLTDALTQWGYEVVAVVNGLAAYQVLAAEEAPRLAVMDWAMPGMDGVAVCRALRGRPEQPYTYVILLTARRAMEDLIQGMDAGADDYVVKPVNVEELEVRLRAGRRVLAVQEQLLAAQRALREQATHDPLTGLWNRAAMLESLDRELTRSQREGTPVGVLLADLDHFKRINDTHGHLTGDVVLREAAHRLRAAVRPYDAVGRYGGEEFLIVLPGCNGARTADLGIRVCQCIGSSPVQTDAGELAVTASVGAAAAEGARPPAAAGLLSAADAALYRAKAAGRNRVETALPESAHGPVAGEALRGTAAGGTVR